MITIDLNKVALILDMDHRDVYLPAITPAIPGARGPRGEDGSLIPVLRITAPGPSLTLNWNDGKHQVIALTGNVNSLVLEGWPSDGILARMTVEFHNAGHFSVTLPTGIEWSEGVDPSITQGQCWRAFTTTTAGAAVNGHVIGNNYQPL